MSKTELNTLKTVENDLVSLLNKGKKVQVEYNRKNGTIYLAEVKTKKIVVKSIDNEQKL